jgi:hypothetical protein
MTHKFHDSSRLDPFGEQERREEQVRPGLPCVFERSPARFGGLGSTRTEGETSVYPLSRPMVV